MQCGNFIDGGPEIDDFEKAPVWNKSSWSYYIDNLFVNLVETGVKGYRRISYQLVVDNEN
jgi:hypothetical protein